MKENMVRIIVAEGAWCNSCTAFFVGSDPDDTIECGHSTPTRVTAYVVVRKPDTCYRECSHKEWDSGHCAEMTCPNYVEKCSQHRYAGND